MHNLIIGETCLLSFQLRRLQIISGKNELFDNMIVNLDGVYELIKDDFKYILDEQHLKYVNYSFYPDHRIQYSKWINTKYSVDYSSIFSWPLFCFFHYDSFNEQQKSSINRKTQRFKSQLEDKENVNLFYYYRRSRKHSIDTILSKSKLFLDYVVKRYDKQFNLFLIDKQTGHSGLSYENYNRLHFYKFTSPCSWIGIDDNWDGHCDNILFDEFLEHYNKILHKKS